MSPNSGRRSLSSRPRLSQRVSVSLRTPLQKRLGGPYVAGASTQYLALRQFGPCSCACSMVLSGYRYLSTSGIHHDSLYLTCLVLVSQLQEPNTTELDSSASFFRTSHLAPSHPHKTQHIFSQTHDIRLPGYSIRVSFFFFFFFSSATHPLELRHRTSARF
ncbi:hypothetical protein LZ30DRAFT_698886 [Colletotrichum cereale]|nr:hypothetical protein LZ30DRAFT_698886 [Colletotrichum cereale]